MIVVGLAALFPGASSARMTDASYCLPADAHTAALAAQIADLMTSAGNQPVRARMGLTQSTTGATTLVTTSSTCQRGSAVLDSAFLLAKSGSKVYMFKVDSFYAIASHPSAGEVQIGFLFTNTSYRYRGVTIMSWH